MSAGMTTGVFARRSRLSHKALRLYEQLGLLVPAQVDPSQGYRRYAEEQLRVARTIALLRRLDMPLARVAEVVAAPGPRAADLVARYWQEVEDRIASQRELAIHVRILLSGGTVQPDRYDILQRDVPEQLVLTEQRHVKVDQLEVWRSAASRRLHAVAAECGGSAGPEFAIFYGEVNEDGDGPVELCLPIHSGQERDHAVRVEPAHREVYVRVTKAQYDFPQILSVYDAIEQSLAEQGLRMPSPPREILITGVDPNAAALGEKVCDVAFPAASTPAI